jgi:hypothetical protein
MLQVDHYISHLFRVGISPFKFSLPYNSEFSAFGPPKSVKKSSVKCVYVRPGLRPRKIQGKLTVTTKLRDVNRVFE